MQRLTRARTESIFKVKRGLCLKNSEAGAMIALDDDAARQAN